MSFFTFLLLILALSACHQETETRPEGLKLLGYTSLPSTLTVGSAPFGGLSGMIQLDSKSNEYLAISDDRSELAPARLVKLKIVFDENKLKAEPLGNITLTRDGAPFKFNEIDSEAITRLGDDLIITSEGSYRGDTRFAPFIRRFSLDGAQKSDIHFDENRYIPEATGEMTKGVRSNLGFESASMSPSAKTLFVVSEAALRQDAPDDYHVQNLVRLMAIDPIGKKPTREYAIKLELVQLQNTSGVLTGNNGISDILAISDDEVLIMERAWISAAKKQVVRLYRVKLDEKAEVSGINKLDSKTIHLKKELIFDMDNTAHKPDNLEILCLGPKVNGKDTLIIASDNNFSKFQINQFYLFEILFK